MGGRRGDELVFFEARLEYLAVIVHALWFVGGGGGGSGSGGGGFGDGGVDVKVGEDGGRHFDGWVFLMGTLMDYF